MGLKSIDWCPCKKGIGRPREKKVMRRCPGKKPGEERGRGWSDRATRDTKDCWPTLGAKRNRKDSSLELSEGACP